jgi:hypothetical protein
MPGGEAFSARVLSISHPRNPMELVRVSTTYSVRPLVVAKIMWSDRAGVGEFTGLRPITLGESELARQCLLHCQPFVAESRECDERMRRAGSSGR